MTARERLVTGLLAGFTILAATHGAWADSGPRYDRRIEEAAIRILQGKLGDIRGPLGLNARGHIYPPMDMRQPDGGKSPWLLLNEMNRMAQIVWI